VVPVLGVLPGGAAESGEAIGSGGDQQMRQRRGRGAEDQGDCEGVDGEGAALVETGSE